MPAAQGTADPVTRLQQAAADYRDARAAVADRGEAELEAVADAYDRATTLLDRYEADATGTGDFQAYVEFQDEFIGFVEGLPDDLLARDAFEAANDRVDKRRLSESDFDAARDALGPARDLVGVLDDRADARDAYRDARRRVRDALDDQRDRISRLETLQSFADVDVDAPVENLRDRIDAYDRAVRDAFDDYKQQVSARDLLAFLAGTQSYPLAAFQQPPDRLREYVEDADAGTEPVPVLREYAEYSQSKLSHYVDDPAALKRAVGTTGTYLDRLDASPLTVSWPPPPADHLRWRARELVSVVDRFADDDVVARLHELRRLSRTDRYDRLRDAAVARDRLDKEERERVESGAVADDLARARDRRDELADALDEHRVE
jgi:hypothetical protein